MLKKQKNKCITITEHYGINTQIEKAIEELNELIIELKKEKFNRKDLLSEIADVYVVLEHIKYIYNIPDDKINMEIDYKLNRQLLRIKDGY